MYINVSNFYKTFSGTDALVFLLFPNCKPICLGNLTTITYSFYRNKKTVFIIGKVNANGVAKGPRIVAGTMIFTVMNQNWANELLDQLPALKQLGNLKSDDLPVFDLMIVCANEYGSSVSMYIYGIDVTDEGQVISVEDMFSENTVSFLGRDIDVPSAFDVLGTSSGNTSIAVLKDNTSSFTINGGSSLSRSLMLTTPYMNGTDVAAIQKLLNMHNIPTTVNGIYDYETYSNIMKFQSVSKLNNSGIVDTATMNYLNFTTTNEQNNYEVTATIKNKNGGTVYALPSFTSKINDKICYNGNIDAIKIDSEWYKTDSGYVHSNDVFSAYEENTNDFNIIMPYDKSDEIKIIQQALNSKLEANLLVTGVYDDDTQRAILAYEQMNNLPSSKNITYDIYSILRSDKPYV